MYYKYVVIGAGLAGLTVAERIASILNEKVLIIEKRNHIGGNIYDSYNEDGILLHNYDLILSIQTIKRFLIMYVHLQSGMIISIELCHMWMEIMCLCPFL